MRRRRNRYPLIDNLPAAIVVATALLTGGIWIVAMIRAAP